jgi:hypothetical protein
MAGGAQVTGVLLALIGTTRRIRARRAERFSFAPGMAQGGATIGLSGRF